MSADSENFLTSPAALREVMARHGIAFQKSLGQNFLINPGVCQKLVEIGGAAPGVGVLEIGPGAGTLTARLARAAEKVVAVELDSGLLPVLAETLAGFSNVKIVQGDALTLDLAKLIAGEFCGMPVVLCANLPYYITSPMLQRLVALRLPVEQVTLLLQKEAAVRLAAGTHGRQTGPLTVAVEYRFEAKVVFSVSAGSFFPAPKVDSAVLRLIPRGAPPVAAGDEAFFFSVVEGAFASRRKTALNSLSAALGLSKETVGRALLAAGAAENVRGEALSLEDFAAIAEALIQCRS